MDVCHLSARRGGSLRRSVMSGKIKRGPRPVLFWRCCGWIQWKRGHLGVPGNWIRFVPSIRRLCGMAVAYFGMAAGFVFGTVAICAICRDCQRMCFEPEPARGVDRLDASSRPPIYFLAGPVQLTVMRPAQRHRKFIADLSTESARLRKTQMVRVAGLAAADEAGLFGHKAQVGLSRRRFASGMASTLLSMRERISSFAAGGSSSAGERSSSGIFCRRARRAWNACRTLSPSSRVRVFALGQARSVQASSSS